jgi:hypothetical protein
MAACNGATIIGMLDTYLPTYSNKYKEDARCLGNGRMKKNEETDDNFAV